MRLVELNELIVREIGYALGIPPELFVYVVGSQRFELKGLVNKLESPSDYRYYGATLLGIAE